jgi:hypothetical protein
MRSDGRIVTRTRLPGEVIARAEAEATARGVPLADHLGDVVVEKLPGFIAEAVRARLAEVSGLAAEIVSGGESVPAVLGQLVATQMPEGVLPAEMVVRSREMTEPR